jgi:hypothetical protein
MRTVPAKSTPIRRALARLAWSIAAACAPAAAQDGSEHAAAGGTAASGPAPAALPRWHRGNAPLRPIPASHVGRVDVHAPSCAPVFPDIVKRARLDGTARLRVVVEPDGQIVDGDIIGASGPMPGHKVQDMILLIHLLNCPATPGTDADGRPMRSTVDLEYTLKWVP